MTIKNDKQLGTPLIAYTSTKANIESLGGMQVGAQAVATDNPTAPLGIYTQGGWHWYSTGGVGGSSSHNSLSGLQGGQANEYYHLTSGTYANLINTREVLKGNRTYYVRTDGSDSNNGLANTAGGAFLTLQKAIDVVSALDISIYDVTIQIADGTYSTSTGNQLKKCLGSGTVTIQGNNSTPSNVVITTTGASATSFDVLANSNTRYTLKDFKLTSSGSGNPLAIVSNLGGTVAFQNLVFGTGFGFQLFAFGGYIEANGNYEIAGGAIWHALTGQQGVIRLSDRTVTLTGTPAFSNAFVRSDDNSLIRCDSMTFSGSATGKRYDANYQGIVQTYGASSTYLPGNVAGTTANGGAYY